VRAVSEAKEANRQAQGRRTKEDDSDGDGKWAKTGMANMGCDSAVCGD